MYTFHTPEDLMDDFIILHPNESTDVTFNLSRAAFDNIGSYSLQALSSGNVEIVPLVSNIPGLNMMNQMKCESIHVFTLKAFENYFAQGEFTDVCTFITFRITPDASVTEEIKLALRLCLKSDLRGKKPIPAPKPTPDFYSAVQGSTLTIDIMDILKNDISEFPLVDIEVSNVIGGTLQTVNGKIIYTHTGRYGEPASFMYKVKDNQGTWSKFPCLVTVDVQMLPRMEGYIFNTAELEQFANSYVPPTLAQIFKTWDRYYNNLYYPSGTTPGGEAANWEMLGSDQFRCTVNSNYLTGFISPKAFEYYEHQADLSSTDTDDDCIALIIAFARIGSNNHSLLLYRESGGIPTQTNKLGFALVYVQNNTYTTIKLPTGNKCWSGSRGENQGNYGWNVTSPTRVKVIRNGNKIQIQSSPFKSSDLSAGEVITIDINDYPSLAWVAGEHQYGYACYSQKYSTYKNVLFSGVGSLNASELYNLDNGDVYTFQSGKWKPNGKKVWDVIGWPREITNIKNGKTYLIGDTTITEITV